MSARIGSLCSGYGGLDMAVMDALPGAEVAWHAQYEPPGKNGREDKNQYPSQILAHHWPGIPNHGDITRADWFEAEPVDILTAGYPCQPISYAGKGLVTEDARWIWPAVAQAVRLLRPSLVYLENVSAHLLRGFTTVASDLARLGYVGSWTRLRASDIGAPHQRERLFILARPADADSADLRHQRNRSTRGGRPGPANGGLVAADARRHPRPQDDAHGTAFGRRGRAAADTYGGRRRTNQHHDAARQSDVAWGAYEPAIRRWEAILGRTAPAPTDERRRLAPQFSEWVMGLPAGWVTDVPNIPRSAQLKALGNGVVPQQGAAAFRILADRLGGDR